MCTRFAVTMRRRHDQGSIPPEYRPALREGKAAGEADRTIVLFACF